MKLSTYSKKTMPIRLKGSPRITLGKNGVLSFNRAAQHTLALAKGSKLSLAQQEDGPGHWFVFKDPADGFEVKLDKNLFTMSFSHKALITAIKKSQGITTAETISFDIEKNPTQINGEKGQYFRLITETKGWKSQKSQS